MFHLGAFEVEFMGRAATFDAVTVYGLICAAVFVAGFMGREMVREAGAEYALRSAAQEMLQ